MNERSGGWGDRWRLAAGDRADMVGAMALTTLGIVGFRTSFGGAGYLVVGAVGAVAGAALGYVIARMRLPLLIGTALGIVGFFVVGAVVLRPDAIGGAFPTPSTFVALLTAVITGWAKLLTAAPPVGSSQSLLVIPLLCGYAGALLSMVLAVGIRRVHACVLPAMGVLAVSVLCGVHRPASLLLQGGVFGAAAIGWMSYRESQKRHALIDTGRTRRHSAGAALLTVTALGAFLVGPHLPLADSRPRFVLRDRTEPPFDPSQYPSPLIGLRRFLDDKRLNFDDTVLFTVEGSGQDGMPAGARLRLAVMDRYDGVVWGVTGEGSSIGGEFERVGEEIVSVGPSRAADRTIDLSFEIRDLQAVVATKPAVWMPVAGEVRSVEFTGARRAELSESFRFDRTTEAAAMPVKLTRGDTYRVSTRLVPEGKPPDMAGRGPAKGAIPVTPDLSDELKVAAVKHTEGATDAAGKAQQLEEWLSSGLYSDGGAGSVVAPGHSVRRLGGFVTADRPVGNAEQFSAAMAVMARSLGLPARVVMGFVTPAGGPGPVEIRGRDVDAWVEIAFEGVGWVAYHPTPDHTHVATPQTETTVAPKKEVGPADTLVPPPPSTIKPANAQLDPPDDPPVKKKPPLKTGKGEGIPVVVLEAAAVVGAPLTMLLALAGVVVGRKARRQRRRRTEGGPAVRIAGAWAELIDHARDLGRPVPSKATRRELAPFLFVPRSVEIAEAADAALFGAEEPTDAAAAAIWLQVDASLQEAQAPLARSHRARAALSLTSLKVRG